MPVIRLTASAQVFENEQRQALIQQLAKERAEESVPNGPVIFEIPLEPTDNFDVLVDTRSDIILEVYKEQKGKISQALGVTYHEALEQHVLPYAVLPMIRKGEANPSELKAVMQKHGGIAFDGDKIDLRFPTMALAEQAHRRLCEEMPKGYWSIVQSVNPLYS